MLLITSYAAADGSEVTSLSLEKIMADPDWMGNAPEDSWFSPDGSMVFYKQKREGSSARDWFVIDAAGGEAELIPAQEYSEVPGSGQVWNRGRDALAWIFDGDVYVHSMTGASTRQLTRTATAERTPVFLTDGRSLAYQADNGWFVFDFTSGETRQLTQVLAEDDPADKAPEGYLPEQQLRLFDTLRRDRQERLDQRAEERAARAADPRRMPTPVYIGAEKEVAFSSLSPNGRHLLVVTSAKSRSRGQQDKMPVFVAESGYVDIEDVRSLVGTGEPADHELMIVDLTSRATHALDISVLPGIKDDPLSWLRKKDNDKAGKKAGKDAEPRPVQTMGVNWSEDGSALALQVQSADNKDRWIASVDFDKHALIPRHRLTDEAWINWDYNEFGFVPGRSDLLWLMSEESGYAHLYTVGAQRGKTRALTSGKWVAKNPVPSPDGAYLYFSANRTHPGEYEIYRVPTGSGEVEQLTALSGLNTFQLSPAADKLLITHSEHLRHPDLWVQSTAQPGEQPIRLTDTMSEAYKAIDWVEPEVLPVPSSHVREPIYSKLYVPRDFDPGKTYPAVMFVHGAGYTQNSDFGWPYYFREQMFHTLLTREGYIVLDMDFRASQGYGRDWRTAIYRQMGHPEVEDLEDGVKWLVENYNVDPGRVGVYGGSYGGFLTFMAMFRRPQLFAAGASLRPVTDWAHYNHGYTSNILNTPEVDPEAYAKSSPIEFAAGLENPLLICHGMLDDNVFFKDTVRLVQRLIELKKENFETAIYPMDPHSFVNPEAWLDEYRRIYKLFETNLK
ncbi:MAG: S9 family peptidase [Gammaproteobacteria bacterium]|nr:S9 family peptidase [Gammaproteobacteria bacterium]